LARFGVILNWGPLTAASPGGGQPVVGALDDPVVLELGDRGEHVKE